MKNELEREIATLKNQLKEAEITIARSRSRDNLARQTAKIGYWDFTASTGYLQWSPEVLNLVAGLPSGEIETTYENFIKFIHKEDIDEVNRVVFKAVENSSPFNVFYRVIHDDESIHWLHGWGGPVEGEDSDKRMVGAVIDITEQKLQEIKYQEAKNTAEAALLGLKETQAQLIQSEKMASLGQLTAGIAHEMNNPMNFVNAGTAILARDVQNLLLLLNKYQQLEKHQKSESLLNEIKELKDQLDFEVLRNSIAETIDDIRLGVSRSTEIIKGLRNFSRPDEEEQTLVDIHESINSSLILLQHELKNKVNVTKDYDNSIEAIPCYPGQINQVFMNILRNAIDAIDDKGEIIIKTKRQEVNIEISIKDNGSGMNEEVKTKIFDPFFTTKEAGKGTGLGLAISYGIIEKHGGTIEVNSKEGQGSEFVITLPISSS